MNSKMKEQKTISLTTKLFFGIAALILLFSIEASAKKYPFQTSSVVPAARGFAKITKDKNRNYVIKIVITDLAEVFRLDPPKLSYIVWIITDEETTMNMGKIDSSKGFILKNLKATFTTVTSLKPVQLFITAEDDPSRQYPGTERILTTDRFKQ
jgi:hypothetical protein